MSVQGVQIILISKPENCSRKKAFIPGKPVTGKIKINCEGLVQLSSLQVTFKGKANVVWREHRATRRNPKTYRNREEYFNYKVHLLGETSIGPGIVDVPFAFTLPQRIPSTFNGAHGSIEYTIKAVLTEKKHFMWSGVHTKKGCFNVERVVNLNTHTMAKNPVQQQASHNFYGFTGRQGTLTMVASVPYSGFVTGERITVNLNAQNMSTVNISRINLILCEKVVWQSRRRKKKITTHELCRMEYPGISVNDSVSRTLQLVVPSFHDDISTCSIIKQNYILRVECVTEGFHMDSSVYLSPLILGTVPFSAPTAAQPLPMPGTAQRSGSLPMAVLSVPGQRDSFLFSEPPPPYSEVVPSPPFKEEEETEAMYKSKKK